MDFLKLLVYRLSAYIMEAEVDKARFILGGAHSLVGRDPTGPRTHLFTKHLCGPLQWSQNLSAETQYR